MRANGTLVGVLSGLTLMFAVGLLDDILDLKPHQKFFGATSRRTGCFFLLGCESTLSVILLETM